MTEILTDPELSLICGQNLMVKTVMIKEKNQVNSLLYSADIGMIDIRR